MGTNRLDAYLDGVVATSMTMRITAIVSSN